MIGNVTLTKELNRSFYIVCAFGVLTCADGFLTYAFGVLTCADGFLTYAFGVLRCADGVLRCADGFLRCADGVLTCADGALRSAFRVLRSASGVSMICLDYYFDGWDYKSYSCAIHLIAWLNLDTIDTLRHSVNPFRNKSICVFNYSLS